MTRKSKHNFFVEMEMEEKPVKGSPGRPNPKPRKRTVVEVSGSRESLIGSPEPPKPKPKPRRRQSRTEYDDNELSSSSATNDEKKKVTVTAFDNPVFSNEDDETVRKKDKPRKRHDSADSINSSPSIHSIYYRESPKTDATRSQNQKRYRKTSGANDNTVDSASESEADSYLSIENEVKKPKVKGKTKNKTSGQLFEVNYESPIKTKKQSPSSRRKEKNKAHVSIEIEKESADQQKAETPPPPAEDPKEEGNNKKTSKKIGAALVGRWKSLLSKSSFSKSVEKEETVQAAEETKSPSKKQVEQTKSPSKKQAQETPPDKVVNSPSPKTRRKVKKQEEIQAQTPIQLEASPEKKAKKDVQKEKSTLAKKSTKANKPILSSIEVEEEPSSLDESETEMKPVNVTKTKPRSRRIEKNSDKISPSSETDADKSLLFGVTIHCTDMLPVDPNVLHPVVKVTLMNEDGSFVKKSSGGYSNNHSEDIEEDNKTEKRKRRKGREKKSSGSAHHQVSPIEAILPIMTQPFSFSFALRNPSFCPSWNELLLYDEPFQKLVQKDSKVILFFEIMDFLPMDNSSPASQPGFHGSDNGWYKLAWAFLKPYGSKGQMNTERKLRLQLYKPIKLKKVSKDPPANPYLPEVYLWYKSEKKVKLLNTTLYVTVKGVLPPQGTHASLRQLLTMKKDELTEAIIESQLASRSHKHDDKETKQSENLEEQNDSPEKENPVRDKRHFQNWSRLEGQSCRIPNKLMASLPSSQIESLNIKISGNVYALKFSPCGLHLAAGLDTEELHVVLIFEIPSGTLQKCLKNHHGLIYDLDWKQIDVDKNSYVNYIASASADSTAVIWSMKNDDPNTLVVFKTLLHPSFVYCVKFHPTHPSVVVTGCFDSLIRVWNISSKKIKENSNESSLLFILDRHGGFVNSLVFDKKGNTLFSGDGESCVLKWSIKSPSKKKSWKLERDVVVSELKVPVNSLSLHPNEGRLLVHLRDNALKILDSQNLICIQTVGGLVNDKLQIRSSYSPCGNLILSGSESPTVFIWDADTSSILNLISPPNHPNCFVSALDYHPHDFYLAMGLASSICEPTPILLYAYSTPHLSNVANVTSSIAKFKSNMLKSRSMDDDLLVSSESKTKKTVRFAAQRGDSSEKFIAIINKLDKALQEAQEPRRFTPTPPNFELSQMKRSVSLDLPNNANNNEQEAENLDVIAPVKPKRKSRHKEEVLGPKEPADINNNTDEDEDDIVEPVQSYLQIHQAQIQSAPPQSPPSSSLRQENEHYTIEKLSPKNLPKPKRRTLPPQQPSLLEEDET